MLDSLHTAWTYQLWHAFPRVLLQVCNSNFRVNFRGGCCGTCLTCAGASLADASLSAPCLAVGHDAARTLVCTVNAPHEENRRHVRFLLSDVLDEGSDLYKSTAAALIEGPYPASYPMSQSHDGCIIEFPVLTADAVLGADVSLFAYGQARTSKTQAVASLIAPLASHLFRLLQLRTDASAAVSATGPTVPRSTRPSQPWRLPGHGGAGAASLPAPTPAAFSVALSAVEVHLEHVYDLLLPVIQRQHHAAAAAPSVAGSSRDIGRSASTPSAPRAGAAGMRSASLSTPAERAQDGAEGDTTAPTSVTSPPFGESARIPRPAASGGAAAPPVPRSTSFASTRAGGVSPAGSFAAPSRGQPSLQVRCSTMRQ